MASQQVPPSLFLFLSYAVTLLRHYRPGKVLELGFPLPWSEGTTRETLNCVDMASFLYGIHYSAGWASEDEPITSIPLPPALAPTMTSTIQESWWEVINNPHKALKNQNLVKAVLIFPGGVQSPFPLPPAG